MASEPNYEQGREVAMPPAWNLVRLDALKNPPLGLVASLYVLGFLFIGAVLILVGYGFIAAFQLAHESVVGKNVEAAKVFLPIILALVGGPLLIWRVVTAHIQSAAARHQATVAEEGLYTSLFTKAVEQLGATREVKTYQEIDDGAGGKKREAVTTTEPNLEVRLGAIFALDRVARDSARDHWPIMEVLCAYVRNPQNTGPPVSNPLEPSISSDQLGKVLSNIRPPRVDVQAALTVIGKRPGLRRMMEGDQNLRLDFRVANLQKAVFDEGHFEGALFSAAALDGASMRRAHLRRANFFDSSLFKVHFEKSDLTSASFLGARLIEADFSESSLEDLNFGVARLLRARFFDTDLSKARFFSDRELVKALGDASTRLPPKRAWPSTWPTRALDWSERYSWAEEGRPPPETAEKPTDES